MKPLSEVAPRLLVIQIQIQAVCTCMVEKLVQESKKHSIYYLVDIKD
jgi:hypothetical protein